ncbi:MAG: PIN domain nuclease [Bacteroidetes bacterium]|nr:PIN domain nuclease [Bacteroidota bacterium]
MILVDTSVWIDYFNGKTNPQTISLEKYLDGDIIIVGDLILAELLQGFSTDDDASAALKELSKCVFYDMVGKEIAVESARKYRYLRKKGITVRKTIDMLIGTFCIYHHIRLLHNDRDFDPLEKYLGLIVA